jgi:hypothetical protein
MSHETISSEKPRSYDAFVEATGLEYDAVALQAFTKELQEYRIKKAEKMDIPLEELHNLPNTQERQ